MSDPKQEALDSIAACEGWEERHKLAVENTKVYNELKELNESAED